MADSPPPGGRRRHDLPGRQPAGTERSWSAGGISDFPPDGTRHAGFEATTELRRKDHGLGFGALGAGLGSVIKVEIDAELVEPA